MCMNMAGEVAKVIIPSDLQITFGKGTSLDYNVVSESIYVIKFSIDRHLSANQRILTMQTCLYCVHENIEGMLYCENCGSTLYRNRDGNTNSKFHADERTMLRDFVQGINRLNEKQRASLYLRNGDYPVEVPDTRQVILGRMGTKNLPSPDIDLTPYGAYEHGVSRHHAALIHRGNQIFIKDLNSRHGTFLNGQRLAPLKSYVLRDGDEIHFAGVVAHIYFEN